MRATPEPDTVLAPAPGEPDALVLDPDPVAVRHARAFTATRCRSSGVCEDTCDTIVLLTSEVVTNAVLHGRSRACLTVAVTATTVRVEVSDDNSRHPTVAPPDDGALDGRGMALVDLLATTWGVHDDLTGKTVWFEITTT